MSNKVDILFLSEEEAEKCINHKEAIEQVEGAWKNIANNQASQFRAPFLKTEETYLGWMGGWSRGTPGFGALTFVNFENAKYGRRSAYGLCVLYDSKTALPLAVMSSMTYLRIIKAVAATALAAKYLAKKDSSKLGLIGAGYANKGHLLTMKELLNLEEVRIFDISTEAQERFVKEMSQYGIKILAMNSIEEAMKGADIVVTATTADAPVIKKDWFEEGMLLLKTGTFQELEPEVITIADKVVTDWWEYTIMVRSKEVKLLLERGSISEDDLKEKKFLHAELPEIAVGRKKGRENDADKIVCIQLGLAADWAAVAAYAYNRALEMGLGQKLNLMAGD